jgi:hypothetical protein
MCLNSGLSRFVFSYSTLGQYAKDMVLSLQDLNLLLSEAKNSYKPTQPASKPILAENIMHPELTQQYNGINEFAKAINGDRSTIRGHIDKGTLYRKQWKITTIKSCT